MNYKIKGNKDLFDRWTKLSKKTSKKMPSIAILSQDSLEVSKQDLSKWFTDSLDEITKVDQDFRETIQEMMKLRLEIVKYLKEQIK